ncbi:hypothetical protein EI94DRAFT_1287353 [Lactarius quietus]|nr:hypothetical protein EI94DRAFT_1287353 [Lactarius quietus]
MVQKVQEQESNQVTKIHILANTCTPCRRTFLSLTLAIRVAIQANMGTSSKNLVASFRIVGKLRTSIPHHRAYILSLLTPPPPSSVTCTLPAIQSFNNYAPHTATRLSWLKKTIFTVIMSNDPSHRFVHAGKCESTHLLHSPLTCTYYCHCFLLHPRPCNVHKKPCR